MLDLSQFEAIIFDMDGTLIDSMPMHLKAWEEAAKQHHFRYESDWIHALGGKPSSEIVQLINQRQSLQLNIKAVCDSKSHAFDKFRPSCCPIPTTLAVLHHYYGKLKLAIGSGSQRRNVNAILEANQLKALFDTIVTANDVEHFKPAPDTFLKAAERLDVSPNKCVVFEDTELGFSAASAAGMHYVKVDKNGELSAVCS